MDFEILINDDYLALVQETELTPIENKTVLSLANDFEDEKWRRRKFNSFVWDNIALTALTDQEREKLAGKSDSTLREAAVKLRLTDKENDKGKGSELAEIVLYGIMQHHYKALPVVPKIFTKQNVQDNAKGADSVHIVLEGEDAFSLWFGEAKFFNSIENARLGDIVESVGKSLQTEKLKKENSIITNMAEVDRLVKNKDLATKIKLALSPDNSMDSIKPILHVPILLLHQCSITAGAKEMNNEYRTRIREYHIDRASAYFKKQIEALSDKVSKYSSIKFHIILFPVPDRQELVDQFTNAVAFYKG
ncbi:HamA C-terminal domain-containing protein [Methyloversatilis sp. MC4-4]|uniref:HamA C-terminal domain-containing protein n=1 Tax=Methyloversatilis sp. MC4-4 TaxID=3132824 RepID=UPI003CE8E2E7